MILNKNIYIFVFFVLFSTKRRTFCNTQLQLCDISLRHIRYDLLISTDN